jgi:hypothetical protein
MRKLPRENCREKTAAKASSENPWELRTRPPAVLGLTAF